MTKDDWIARAEASLQPHLEEASREYAETLYTTYVEGESSLMLPPEDVVEEAMSYW